MIPEDAAKYLWDARRAAERIARFVAGHDGQSYLADAIPDLARIIAFRNVLIHGYATVDDRLVWGVVEGHLPALLVMLARLLDGAEARPGSP